MDAHDAYLAGLFDGEGCISWNQGRAVASFANNNRRLCELFKERFGGTVHPSSFHCFEWKAYGKSVEDIEVALGPFLKNKSFSSEPLQSWQEAWRLCARVSWLKAHGKLVTRQGMQRGKGPGTAIGLPWMRDSGAPYQNQRNDRKRPVWRAQ